MAITNDRAYLRRLNNQLTLEDMQHKLETGHMKGVDGSFCETMKMMGFIGATAEDMDKISTCLDHVVKGLNPCNGCQGIDILCYEKHTLIDWE